MAQGIAGYGTGGAIVFPDTSPQTVQDYAQAIYNDVHAIRQAYVTDPVFTEVPVSVLADAATQQIYSIEGPMVFRVICQNFSPDTILSVFLTNAPLNPASVPFIQLIGGQPETTIPIPGKTDLKLQCRNDSGTGDTITAHFLITSAGG